MSSHELVFVLRSSVSDSHEAVAVYPQERLSEYECQRLENIKQNQEFLCALQLPQVGILLGE